VLFVVVELLVFILMCSRRSWVSNTTR